MTEIQAKKMPAAEWGHLKARSTCSICRDTGTYQGYAHPLVGTETKAIKCGCSYPDAHKTGHYPPRIPKP